MSRIYTVVSLKRGLAPFTRRDLVALAQAGHEVTVLPAKVGAAASVPETLKLAYAGKARRAADAAAGLARALGEANGRRLLREVVAGGDLAAFLLACSFFVRLPRPDLLYAVFGDRKLFTAYYLSLLWDCPLTVTVHAYEVHNNPRPGLFRKALARCARVVTVTDFNRALLVEKWGVPAGKIDVVRVSVDEHRFDPEPRFVVLIVGSVGYIKGHETLFEAVRRLGDPGIEVWVVGGPAGAHPEEPEALARAAGVEGQCVFFGWVSETAVAALMRRSDVLCVPSRRDPSGNYEGFPTVLAEAMAVGLPVITTRHSEIPAVVKATLVAEDSPGELADALRRYMASAEARAEDAAANREVAERLFIGAQTRRLDEVLTLAAQPHEGAAGADGVATEAGAAAGEAGA